MYSEGNEYIFKLIFTTIYWKQLSHGGINSMAAIPQNGIEPHTLIWNDFMMCFSKEKARWRELCILYTKPTSYICVYTCILLCDYIRIEQKYAYEIVNILYVIRKNSKEKGGEKKILN